MIKPSLSISTTIIKYNKYTTLTTTTSTTTNTNNNINDDDTTNNNRFDLNSAFSLAQTT